MVLVRSPRQCQLCLLKLGWNSVGKPVNFQPASSPFTLVPLHPPPSTLTDHYGSLQSPKYALHLRCPDASIKHHRRWMPSFHQVLSRQGWQNSWGWPTHRLWGFRCSVVSCLHFSLFLGGCNSEKSQPSIINPYSQLVVYILKGMIENWQPSQSVILLPFKTRRKTFDFGTIVLRAISWFQNVRCPFLMSVFHIKIKRTISTLYALLSQVVQCVHFGFDLVRVLQCFFWISLIILIWFALRKNLETLLVKCRRTIVFSISYFDVILQGNTDISFLNFSRRAVTDPRTGKRIALKKMPNVFQNIVSSKRVYRELRMLCYFKHDNVSLTLQFFLNSLSHGRCYSLVLC